jgi:Ca2+-binding RTX toxin-like protein
VAPSWGPAYGTGRCTISGTIHADVLVGTSANDVICGGAGNDTIYARDGHRDVVDGGPGRDVARLDRKLDRVTNVEVKRYR